MYVGGAEVTRHESIQLCGGTKSYPAMPLAQFPDHLKLLHEVSVSRLVHKSHRGVLIVFTTKLGFPFAG